MRKQHEETVSNRTETEGEKEGIHIPRLTHISRVPRLTHISREKNHQILLPSVFSAPGEGSLPTPCGSTLAAPGLLQPAARWNPAWGQSCSGIEPRCQGAARLPPARSPPRGPRERPASPNHASRKNLSTFSLGISLKRESGLWNEPFVLRNSVEG